MKYQSLSAFEKHLKDAAPHHLSPVYLVAVACDYERRLMMNQIISFIKDPSIRRAGEGEIPLDELRSPSLFGGMPVVIIESPAKDEALLDYLTHPRRDALLLIGATSGKTISDFYPKGKKEMIVLDLLDEKPWEKQRRMGEWIQKKTKDLGLKISSDVVMFLLEHVSTDMPALSQEIDKLHCFLGDRKEITLSDVKTMCSLKTLSTSWQLAEGLVWGKPRVPAEYKSDPSFLFMFIGQVRYHLQIGYAIANLVDKRVPPTEISNRLPSIKPYILEKHLAPARTKGSRYFKKGLEALFELEFALKSSALDTSILFDRFLGKLVL
jgi:DNA polymerase-3 subunit delta